MIDPLDTISKLIFQWALEGGEDLLPKNGTEQDDHSLKKLKLVIMEYLALTFSFLSREWAV